MRVVEGEKQDLLQQLSDQEALSRELSEKLVGYEQMKEKLAKMAEDNGYLKDQLVGAQTTIGSLTQQVIIVLHVHMFMYDNGGDVMIAIILCKISWLFVS